MGASQNIVPTLQIVNGAQSGRLYQLDREVTVIGRNADCDVVLVPKSVSRKHAAIVRRNGGFVLKDLGSTRGTFVDGQRLTQPSVLTDASTIQVGEIVLTFNSQLVQIQDSSNDQSTVYAAIDLLQQSDRILPLVKPETKLRALRLISQELGSTLVLSEILERIFNSLFEIFPRAERGFVLLRDTNSQNLVPEVIRSRNGPAGELRISKTILNRVLEEGQAILSKDLGRNFLTARAFRTRRSGRCCVLRFWIRSRSRWVLFRSTRATVGGASSKRISTCLPRWPVRSVSRFRTRSCTGRFCVSRKWSRSFSSRGR